MHTQSISLSILCLILCGTVAYGQQPTTLLNPLHAHDHIHDHVSGVASEIKEHYEFLWNTNELLTRRAGDDLLLHVPVGPEDTLTVVLWQHQLRSDQYSLVLASGAEHTGTRPRTYRGVIDGNLESRVTMTINEDYFHLRIASAKNTYIVEQHSRHDRTKAADQMIVYSPEDVLPHGHECGNDNYAKLSESIWEQGRQQVGSQRRVGECYEVEIALAADWLLYDDEGGATATENEITSILNDVQTNYDNEFADELDYSLVTVFLSDCSTCDPWTSSTSSEAFLEDFTDWADDGGFGVTHDVATAWTNRNFNGTTIGLAWIGAVCTAFRYNVCEHFSNNSDLLRVLQAHELGHNWDATHDGSGTNFIMAPSVTNTDNWSGASISDINSFVASRNCLADCPTGEPVPVAEFEAEITAVCAGGTTQFTDQSSNNPTSWSWTFPGGTPSSSTEQHPKVSYNNPGTYSVTLTATNGGGSDTRTRNSYISVGDGRQDIIECINFEDGLEDWTVENPDGGIGWEVVSASGQRYGEQSLWLDNFSYSQAGRRDALLSPIIDLEARDNITLLVEYAYARRSSSRRDSMVISISTDGGDTFERIFADTEDGSGNFATHVQTNQLFEPEVLADWCLTGFGPNCLTLDLTPYAAASQAQIMIENVTGRGNSMYLDNISIIAGCAPSAPPMAEFNSGQNFGCTPLTVEFFDASTGAVQTRLWTFDGGVPATSTEIAPVVTYSTPGNYDVSLVVTNVAGSDTETKVGYVQVANPPTADFSYTRDGLLVNFTNLSTEVSDYLWDFGDGQSSNEENPSHLYATDGSYEVTLTVANACGQVEYSEIITVGTPPTADFEADEPEGCAEHTVNFTNLSSINATDFTWEFPGGNPATSSAFEPTVVYSEAGTYSVTLTASNSDGSDTKTITDYIIVSDIPIAAFDFAIDELTVAFIDESEGADTYLWDFGDGTTSTANQPTHTYASDGTYTVTLTVENECGQATTSRVVTISNFPVANFTADEPDGCVEHTVVFTNLSSSNAENFLWTFEGGTPATSTEENPVVIYDVAGTYDVELRASNGEGEDVIVREDYIIVGDIPMADFSLVSDELEFTFTNLSTGATDYEWDFGDGNSSEEANPVHTYASPGNYLVTLVVTNSCGTDFRNMQVSIIDQPIADYAQDVTEGCLPLVVQFTDRSSENTQEVRWSFPGGTPSTSTDRNPTVTYSARGSYDVTLISFSSNASDTLTVTDAVIVQDVPVADFSDINNGLVIDFVNESIDGQTYLWDFGDGTNSNEENPTHTYELNGDYVVCLDAVNDCGDDRICKTISTAIAPIAGIGSNVQSGCVALTVEYSDQSQGMPDSWLWTFPGGEPSTSTEQNPTVVYSESGTYSVTLSVTNAQGTQEQTFTDYIIVFDDPMSEFTVDIDALTVQFTDASVDADSVHWDFGDGNGSNIESPSHEYMSTGDYTVTQYVYNVCGVDSSSQVISVMSTSTQDISSQASIDLYPNPTSDLFTVKGDLESDMQLMGMDVLDIYGRIALSQSMDYTGAFTHGVDASHLTPGTYLVVLRTTSGVIIKKLIRSQASQ